MTRTQWILILLILIGVLVLYSSGLAWTWGSGRIVSEVRKVPAFDSIDLRGSGRVHLKEGPEQFLKVETDDNLLKRLETKVVSGCLRIGFRPGTIHGNRCEIYITIPRCKNLSISGSGSIESEGMVRGDELSLNISGSGDAILDLETRKMNVTISGSGNADLAGQTDELNSVISGSGNLEAFGFETEQVNLTISGSGNSQIKVNKVLNARISGSGTVDYKGKPSVNVQISGSGRARSVE